MLQGGWITSAALEVREPPILHRTQHRSWTSRVGPTGPVHLAYVFLVRSEIGTAAGMEGARWTGQVGPDRRAIEGHCCLRFLARSRLVCDPILISVVLQVPGGTFFFLLGAGMGKVRQGFYWTTRGGIEAIGV